MRNTFFEIAEAKFHNKPIKVRCIVSGKSLDPYCIPKKITVGTIGEDIELEIEPSNPHLLKFIDIQSFKIPSIVKQICGLSKIRKCEVTEVQNVERIFIMPDTGRERNKSSSSFTAYFIGYGLEINTAYELSGYATVDPTNQKTTYVFISFVKVKSDIESFNMTKPIHDALEQFIPKKERNTDDIFEHLHTIYTYYAHNITKIYDRFDLHLAIDLAFRTPMSFRLDHEIVKKGWADIMVIGDTRCGKGYVAESLVKYFGLGEVISGENCSTAGLIAGLQQFNKHWVVTWGKIPLNDMGLVVVDEASEIKLDEWSKLSRVRSEGIAEITKIHTQVTNARTRLIWLSNPILKTISNYSYGIQAILDVVKSPEDIARFDYVLVVAHNEVDVNTINQTREPVQSLYPAKSEQDLILWVWSRKLNEIVFEREAIDAIYKTSVVLSKTYTFGIPLIQGENIRIKLAKIAVAFAGRLYSHKKNGELLFVKKIHVECALRFLRLIYEKPASGYYDFSTVNKKLDMDAKLDTNPLERYFNAYRNKDQIYSCLLSNNSINIDVISEYINQPREVVREIISKLISFNCLIRKNANYTKTPAFTNWLRSAGK